MVVRSVILTLCQNILFFLYCCRAQDKSAYYSIFVKIFHVFISKVLTAIYPQNDTNITLGINKKKAIKP